MSERVCVCECVCVCLSSLKESGTSEALKKTREPELHVADMREVV